LTKSDDLKPTSAAEWRRPRESGITIELPSGNAATIRPVALDVLMQQGQIPDTLTPLVTDLLWTTVKQSDIVEGPEEKKIAYQQLINIIVPAVLISPSVYIPPPAGDDDDEIVDRKTVLGDNEIMLEDIDFDDKLLIFKVSMLPTDQIRSFRLRQMEPLANVPDGEGDVPAAE
jgi:hypothetical protein